MRYFLARPHWRQFLLAGLCLLSASAMCANGDAEFDVHSPSVMAIRKSLAERHVTLKVHFEAGVIGFTYDGLVAMREPGRLAPDVRSKLELLVAEDNKDRGTMYREIARANNHPEWEAQIKATFGERWISRASSGWYYQNAQGQWVKK